MTKNPAHYGLQLPTSDPAAVKAAILEKFVNIALKKLAEHGLVQISATRVHAAARCVLYVHARCLRIRPCSSACTL